MLRRLWTMARWSVEQRGLLGTVGACWARLGRSADQALPTQPHPFDLRHGTDTGGLISGGRLATGTAGDKHITAYAGISPSRLNAAMDIWIGRTEPRPLSGYTFLDLGCGKGRALLLASQRPFGSVVGIELNPELARIAGANVQLWLAMGLAKCSIEVRCGDAREVQLPTIDCLIFLYNPFSASAMCGVLDAIDRQARESQALYILYQNESEETPLRSDHRVHLLWRGSLPQPDEERLADPVSSPDDVTSLYRWVGKGGMRK